MRSTEPQHTLLTHETPESSIHVGRPHDGQRTTTPDVSQNDRRDSLPPSKRQSRGDDAYEARIDEVRERAGLVGALTHGHDGHNRHYRKSPCSYTGTSTFGS